MKRLVAIVASLLITLSSLTPAFAWGDEGHQTVGKIASLQHKTTYRAKTGSDS